jgi:hypothetical protein
MGVDTRALLRVTTDEGMTTPLRTATEARMKTRLTRRTKVIPIAGTIANKSEINDPTTFSGRRLLSTHHSSQLRELTALFTNR